VSEASSLVELLTRASRRRTGGLILLGKEERRLSWAELHELAERRAAGLRRAGLEPGDRVVLALQNSEELLACLFGAMLAGGVPCAMSPPQGLGTRAAFGRRLDEVTTLLTPRLVVAAGEVEARVPVRSPRDLDHTPAAGGLGPAARPEDAAFVQLTSGSTGPSKGVVLEHRAVLANVEQIAEASGVDADTRCVVWLPLFHDMGLVGGTLGCLARGGTLLLSTPYRFLRRPLHWLEAISRHQATHSPAPTFAYRHVVQRVPSSTAQLDLSSWRAAYVGAEPIEAAVLRGFEERFAGCGFSGRALLPCYGMAEASLAVTLSAQEQPWAARAFGRRALAVERRAEEPASPEDAREVVSCGPALAGTEVEVRDAEGQPVPEGREGEVHFRGPSLLRGYWDEEPRRPTDWFASGDCGVLLGGELYVTGRNKELMILRGENHHPAEVEWAARDVDGVRRVAAFGVVDPEQATERLCLVVETERGANGELSTSVRRRVHELTGLTVSELKVVPRGSLPTTTSGKLQRGLARSLFLQG
jgi:fatty-acyl-CoA synthase